MAKKKGESVDVESLKELVRRVFLNGAIDSCILEIDEEGTAEVYAIDVSNVIFLYASEDLGIEDEQHLGLGNLDLLNKFIGTVKEKEVFVQFRDNRIVIEREKYGRLDYLLTSPELIPTALEEKDETIENLVDATIISATLSAEFVSTLAAYFGMVKAKEMTIRVDDGKVFVAGGTDTGHKYEIEIQGDTEFTGDDEEDFHVSVYGDYFLAILNVLDFDEQPQLMLAPNSPVVIVQGEDNENVWGLVPVSAEETSHDD